MLRVGTQGQAESIGRKLLAAAQRGDLKAIRLTAELLGDLDRAVTATATVESQTLINLPSQSFIPSEPATDLPKERLIQLLTLLGDQVAAQPMQPKPRALAPVLEPSRASEPEPQRPMMIVPKLPSCLTGKEFLSL